MFLETSAKTAYNVVEAFNLSAQTIMNSAVSSQNVNNNEHNANQSKVLLNPTTNTAKPKQQGCC